MLPITSISPICPVCSAYLQCGHSNSNNSIQRGLFSGICRGQVLTCVGDGSPWRWVIRGILRTSDPGFMALRMYSTFQGTWQQVSDLLEDPENGSASLRIYHISISLSLSIYIYIYKHIFFSELQVHRNGASVAQRSVTSYLKRARETVSKVGIAGAGPQCAVVRRFFDAARRFFEKAVRVCRGWRSVWALFAT